MAHSFIAYIDESGDDGLNGRLREAGRQGGSSHWLTIGATIWRHSHDLEAVRWARALQAKMPAQRRDKTLHFAEMDHGQRVMAVIGIRRKPLRIVTVISNKPVIPAGVYVEKNQLYHYMCRYLIERISWLCRDYRRDVPEGDGKVKIIFARRGGMSYPDFQNYLWRLERIDDPDIQIHWPVIDIPAIEAHDQGAKYGLQLADIAVSGLTWGLEHDFYGNCELRFARLLKGVVYNRRGNYMSYGTKMVPPADRLILTEQQREFVELFDGKLGRPPGP